MIKKYDRELSEIEFPSLGPQDMTVFRIAANRLEVGMYVVALDRPWTDTPFPSTGIYLAESAQVIAIRGYCESALIDIELSDPGRVSAVKVAARLFEGDDSHAPFPATRPLSEDAAASPPAVPASAPIEPVIVDYAPVVPSSVSAVPRSDARVSRGWRPRLRQLLVATGRAAGLHERRAGLMERAQSWIVGAQRQVLSGSSSMATLRTRFGTRLGSRAYLSNTKIGDAIPAARNAYAALLSANALALRAARHSDSLPWEPIARAIGLLCDSIIEHPDAILWCDRMHEQRTLGNRPPATPAVLMAHFARHLGLPRDKIEVFAAIGLTIDLGKARVPSELLNHPGQLESGQFELIKSHVATSLSLLRATPGVPPSVLRGVAEHHERCNGSGYPRGLRSANISLYGACAGIVDCYTALISARSYANPLAPEDALAVLLGWSPALFETALVEQFAMAIGLFPVGSAVELSEGGLGVVIDQGRGDAHGCEVLVLTAPDGRPLRTETEHASSGQPSYGFDPTRGQGLGFDIPKPEPFKPDIRRGDAAKIAQGLPVGAYGVRLPDIYATRQNRLSG